MREKSSKDTANREEQLATLSMTINLVSIAVTVWGAMISLIGIAVTVWAVSK
jgi:hypothetical protein